MLLTLLEESAKIIQFPSKKRNNKVTIEALKDLLILAESGQLIGIAGVGFEIHEATSCFVIGDACESISNTIYELDKLRSRISN
ncbi:MAG: hypothetical protein HOO90_00970 [Methylotenera sp.]|uniref:hypothetical protein n=1 Tax=Methylotenera sp. TaxID=2051956 RepID=UPI001853653F|nr:hypothetical protein [Methylotenera sp.]NOU24087.1 hypothetical protein [Methylotenera sp.]